jgi:D-3-phosphoglycerate dehydrogenase
MFHIQTLNEISPVIADVFDDTYAVAPEFESPDAILVRSADLHKRTLPAGLAAIARAGAGVNNIPIDACSQAGIVVFNTPGANANAVAELVIAAMLLTGRDILRGVNWVGTLKGSGDAVPNLVEKGKARFVGPELRGKTLGVLGLGAIGALVANAAIGLGMEVLGCDPFISVDHAWSLSRSIRRITSREELIRRSDFITVHIPLTPETRGLFGRDTLAQMKPDAALLNFSRGELADTDAVLEALNAKTLRAYVTDFPCEALIDVPGALCIPHLGASTPESEDNCARMAAQQLRAYLEQGSIQNSVNLPDVDLPRTDANRVTILHQNIPGVLGSITALVAGDNINIANMINKSKGTMAYTVLDIDGSFTDARLTQLRDLEGVLRVRTIH